MARETVYFCLDSRHSGGLDYEASAVVLLTLYLGVLSGLLLDSRTAWWVGVLAVGSFGVLHAIWSWPSIRASLPGYREAKLRMAREYEYLWFRGPRALKTLDLIGECLSNGLLIAVPVLLIVDRIRWRLRKDRVERIKVPE